MKPHHLLIRLSINALAGVAFGLFAYTMWDAKHAVLQGVGFGAWMLLVDILMELYGRRRDQKQLEKR